MARKRVFSSEHLLRTIHQGITFEREVDKPCMDQSSLRSYFICKLGDYWSTFSVRACFDSSVCRLDFGLQESRFMVRLPNECKFYWQIYLINDFPRIIVWIIFLQVAMTIGDIYSKQSCCINGIVSWC